MSLFDKDTGNDLLKKAKEFTGKIKDKTFDFISDEALADMIIMAVSKQENVNQVLSDKESLYRINGVDVEMGIPPKVIFEIKRIKDDLKS